MEKLFFFSVAQFDEKTEKIYQNLCPTGIEPNDIQIKRQALY